jgi:hypothetical protein
VLAGQRPYLSGDKSHSLCRRRAWEINNWQGHKPRSVMKISSFAVVGGRCKGQFAESLFVTRVAIHLSRCFSLLMKGNIAVITCSSCYYYYCSYPSTSRFSCGVVPYTMVYLCVAKVSRWPDSLGGNFKMGQECVVKSIDERGLFRGWKCTSMVFSFDGGCRVFAHLIAVDALQWRTCTFYHFYTYRCVKL